MNRTLAKVALVAGALALLAAAGCTSATSAEQKDPKIWGYVAAAGSAQIELAEDQDGVDELGSTRLSLPVAPGSSCTRTTTTSPACAWD